MGGAVQKVGQAVGVDKKPQAPRQQQQQMQSTKSEIRASRMDEEQGARMRGARRRGRALLSDARLSTEAGMETLGGGNNLG